MNSRPANLPSAAPPLARTPLHHWHERSGGRMGEWDGWQVAEAFAGAEKEVAATKTGLAIADISAFPKLNFLGAGVPALTQTLGGDSRASKPLGVAASTADPLVLACRLKTDQLLVMALTTNRTGLEKIMAKIGPAQSAVRQEMTSGAGEPLVRQDVTSTYGGLWLIGPNTEWALRQVTHHDVGSMPVGSCAETGLAGVPAILIRPPKLSVPSMQILIAWDVAEYVWETVLETGRKWGIVPLGMEALEVLLQEEAE